jgi:hypothetical protein
LRPYNLRRWMGNRTPELSSEVQTHTQVCKRTSFHVLWNILVFWYIYIYIFVNCNWVVTRRQ